MGVFKEKIYGCIASIPTRAVQLQVVLDSILSQVDELVVFLNNYDSIPDFLHNKKIKFFRSQNYGDQADNGKFWLAHKLDGYIFTLDDDIKYPNNYIQILIKKIEQYKRKALICVHGNIIPFYPIKSYYKDKKGLHFAKLLLHDVNVDVPGTGTLAYHSELLQINISDFPQKHMTDIWIFVLARQKSIPIIAIEREVNWLQQLAISDFRHSIYAQYSNNDQIQTELINRYMKFPAYNR